MGSIALSNIFRAMQLVASSSPRYGTIFVNTNCNRRCPYCVVPDQGSGRELPSSVWCSIIDKLHGWGVRLVSVLGGEPTLRRDLPEIISHASKKVSVSLTSNGDTFVGDKGRQRLSNLAVSGLSVLNLSLHELEETDRQLDSLVEAKKLGIIPILATVVTRATIKELPHVMREANRRGILYRYTLYQNVGGSFSAQVDSLIPTKDEVDNFTTIVNEQQRRTRLIQNTRSYMVEGTEAYPRGWHCDSYKDHWVIVDNEGRLMACSEYPTFVSVLDIPTLSDSRWTKARTKRREACSGCSFQCYMDEEGLSRLELVREGVGTAIGLLKAPS